MKVFEVLVNKRVHNVKILKRENSSFIADVDGKTVEVKLLNSGGGKLSLEVNGEKFEAEFLRFSLNIIRVKVGRKIFEVQRLKPTFKPETLKIESLSVSLKKPTVNYAVGKNAVLAPIAGRILALKVGVGQKVSRGECICILEAMKMANEVAAPKDGIVKEILVSEGAVVNKGDILAVIT